MPTQFIDFLKEINFLSYITCLLLVLFLNWNKHFSEIRDLYIFLQLFMISFPNVTALISKIHQDLRFC